MGEILSKIPKLQSDMSIKWKIKAHAHPTLFLDVGMAVLFAFPAAFYLYGMYFHESENSRHSVFSSATVGMVMVFIFWIGIARQRTLYNYRISEKGGEVDYWLYYYKYSGALFKGIAIFVFVAILAMISIMPSMIFALAGVGGVTIVAAVKLWCWENKTNHRSFEWHRAQLIFTDRKRNLVILQRRYDPDIPFEENFMYFEVFLPKGKVDEFLDVCKKYAPPHVDYEEGRLKY